VARRLVAELIRYATLGFAAVLGRAIEESNMHPPEISLAAATLTAVAQVPFKLIARRIADKEERRLVERMYDELLATGTVEKHLAEDDRTVRELHAREVLAKRPPQTHVSKVFPFKPREQVVTRVAQKRAARSSDSSNVVALRASPPPVRDEDRADSVAASASPRPKAGSRSGWSACRGSAARAQTEPPPRPAEPRFYLTLDSDVVDGPRSAPRRSSAWLRTASGPSGI
jgi:hypothetical protein